MKEYRKPIYFLFARNTANILRTMVLTTHLFWSKKNMKYTKICILPVK